MILYFSSYYMMSLYVSASYFLSPSIIYINQTRQEEVLFCVIFETFFGSIQNNWLYYYFWTLLLGFILELFSCSLIYVGILFLDLMIEYIRYFVCALLDNYTHVPLRYVLPFFCAGVYILCCMQITIKYVSSSINIIQILLITLITQYQPTSEQLSHFYTLNLYNNFIQNIVP